MTLALIPLILAIGTYCALSLEGSVLGPVPSRSAVAGTSTASTKWTSSTAAGVRAVAKDSPSALHRSNPLKT